MLETAQNDEEQCSEHVRQTTAMDARCVCDSWHSCDNSRYQTDDILEIAVQFNFGTEVEQRKSTTRLTPAILINKYCKCVEVKCDFSIADITLKVTQGRREWRCVLGLYITSLPIYVSDYVSY